ncbi:hypothetical protein Y032_0140g2161 [Ancylostoma ceylanicum]|nr:hypothetical protein Y032_0140g2161 [Ancylostoma ceylanicum]
MSTVPRQRGGDTEENRYVVISRCLGYSQLRTVLDKERDRGTAFLGETLGLCTLALVVCCDMALDFSAADGSRQSEPACTAPVSLPKNAAPRSHPLSTAVWSSLYKVLRCIDLIFRRGTNGRISGARSVYPTINENQGVPGEDFGENAIP